MEKVGTEKIQDALKSLCELANKVDKSFEDGKIDVFEGIGIATTALKSWKTVKNFKDIALEINDLTDEERQELIILFNQEFDLKGDKAEEIVEACVKLLISMTELIGKFKKD